MNKIFEWLWHNIQRFTGVILIAVVIIGGPFSVYRYGYNKGYKIGYAQSSKDNPQTVVTGGTVTQIQESRIRFKWPFFVLKWWFMRLQSSDK